MSDRNTTRRQFVAVAAGTGLASVAGCLGSGSDDERGGDADSSATATEEAPTATEGTTATDTATPESTATATATASSTETGPNPASLSVDEYLADTSNYDGTVTDYTEYDEVDVATGAEGNGGPYAFDPPAVEVTTGTTVVWTWTGETIYNVVHEGGEFESGVTGGTGHTFEHTFESTGTYRYYSEPLEQRDMRGVIVVTEG